VALTTDPERTRGLLDDFCHALSAATQLEVTAHGMGHYHHLQGALEAGDIQIVWLPPLLALRAAGKGLLKPLALPVRHGVSTYSTALFTRRDSPIRKVDQLQALSAAWVDRQSASGYMIIRAQLRAKGVELDKAFTRNQFYGAHDAVAEAVISGEADVGATFVYLDPDASTGIAFPKSAGWGDAPVHVISYAGSIPCDMLAANTELSETVTNTVQEALVGPEHPDLERAARRLLCADSFVPPLNAHLDPLLEILKNLEPESDVPAHSGLPSLHRRPDD